MTLIRSRDLKTSYKVVTKQTTGLNVGGQALLTAPGQKRWITFLSIDSLTNARISSFKLYLASVGVSNPTLASIVATGNRKLNFAVTGTQISRCDHWLPVIIPREGPRQDTPIFSIAGGKWLGVYASLATVGVFMQYFDE
jgi:hypothetical protein